MKKLVSLLSCLSILLLLSACFGGDGTLQHSDVKDDSISESNFELSEATETEDMEAVESSQPESSQATPSNMTLMEADCPVPDFLDVEQQILYRRTRTAFIEYDLYNSGFQSEISGEPDFEQDGMPYYKCNGYITKWADFEEAMLSVFTAEYFDKLNKEASYTDGDGVFHERTIFTEQNGDLYFCGGGRGGRMDFVFPETFEIESQDDSEIRFYLISTYDEFAFNEDGSVTLTEDGDYLRVGNPTQEKYLITMIKGPEGWRFSEFHLPY